MGSTVSEKLIAFHKIAIINSVLNEDYDHIINHLEYIKTIQYLNEQNKKFIKVNGDNYLSETSISE